MRLCAVDGCNDRHYCHGYCIKHYSRNKKHGDPLAGRAFEGQQMAFLEGLVGTQETSCIEWPYGVQPSGYGRIKDGYVSRGSHRVMCRLAHGDPADQSYHAAHSCNNKKCVNPNHLRWATVFENVKDRDDSGRTSKGSKHWIAKLTEEQAVEIAASSEPLSILAKRYGVNKTTISRIKRGLGWKHATARSLRAA